jgi:hypothetical protein
MKAELDISAKRRSHETIESYLDQLESRHGVELAAPLRGRK